MASTSKGQQKKGKKVHIMDTGRDFEEETAVPLSVTQALQNDLVLESIFSYLPVPDLKVCRQVCQQWKQATRRSIVDKCNPIRFFAKSTDFVRAHISIGEMAKLTSVLSTCNGSEFPVTKFLVDANIAANLYVEKKMDRKDGEEILRQFFQAIGPLATELEIRYIDSAKLFELCAPLNIEFPRLKTLKLTSASGYFPPPLSRSEETNIRSNLAFCQNILENAPQLSTLDINCARPDIMDILINLMERTLPGRKLSTLLLDVSFLENQFVRLAGIGLTLTSLRLNLMVNSSLKEVGEGWMSFLESQSDTLEKLHLECDGIPWDEDEEEELTVRIPQLRKLKRLTLRSSYRTIRFSGMFYTGQFPALKHLSLWLVSNRSLGLEPLLNSNIQPVSTVEILEVPRLLDDPAWILHAARIFPNVKKLKIPGAIDIVQTVFQAWQTVEQLTIKNVGIGESADKLLAVNFSGVLPSNSRIKTSGEPDKFLQNLKTLRLEGFNNAPKSMPTARICYFVFLKMGSLKCLDLSECSQFKISKYLLTIMRKQFVVLCQEKKERKQNIRC